MQTHFLHPGNSKSETDEAEEVLFHVGECPWKFIICLLDVLKCDFREVDEAMFKGVERPFELNFCILDTEKSDLIQVA
jgi:hypothetical protein